MRHLFTSWLDFLLIFVPVTVALDAGLLGRATEHLTSHVGAGIGALLNASLGNATGFIIAIVALREGLHDVVKASLTGSIIGNILLVLPRIPHSGPRSFPTRATRITPTKTCVSPS